MSSHDIFKIFKVKIAALLHALCEHKWNFKHEPPCGKQDKTFSATQNLGEKSMWARSMQHL